MFIEQNEVMLAIPLDRLLAWAYRVQKQTQFVVVVPYAVTFEQGMQTESGVFEPETLFVDQSMVVEAIQPEADKQIAEESEMLIVDSCCLSVQSDVATIVQTEIGVTETETSSFD
eukprot:2708474-Amphidinium_carterae.1